HRWLAVVGLLVADSTSPPSVPRFNPKIVNPKTGGGYRLLSWIISFIYFLYKKLVSLIFP
ncbi:hypothetical protein LKE08_09610, partial [Lyngbya sp. CCY1209]|nr:hypothetical protein [Lyngbya sp. CCY1209]